MADAPVTPRPAATVVVVRGDAPFEVFLVRRHARSGFMANAYVFPGGAVDAEDGDAAVVARLRGADLEALRARMAGVDDVPTAAAHLAAAVRETFEEAGVLLADGSVGLGEAARADWRSRLHAREATLGELLVGEDLVVDAGGLHYIDHWITPVFERRRFDARFFVSRVAEAESAAHDGHETTDSLWITPAEALERHAAQALALAPPQWVILRRLAELRTWSALEAWASSLGEVPATMPHMVTEGGTFVLALPGDPRHPDTVGEGADLSRVVLRGGVWTDR